LFGGISVTEPITLAAKFTNISNSFVVDSELKPQYIDDKEFEEISKNDTSLISNNDTLDVFENESDPGFDIGLLLGITIGIAIGISFIFIIRQKNT